jgi:hypothetical protein
MSCTLLLPVRCPRLRVQVGQRGGCCMRCAGRYGALGHGDFENRAVPQAVEGLRGVAGCQLACGGDHTVVLDAGGGVWAWGRGTWGQTGQGHTDNTCLPQRVCGALQGRRVVQVAAGARHTLCLAADNSLLAFGSNECGQLAGPAPAPAQPTAQLVRGLPDSPILFVAAGGDTSAVVVDRGASLQAGPIGEAAPGDSAASPDCLPPWPARRRLRAGGARAAASTCLGLPGPRFRSPHAAGPPSTPPAAQGPAPPACTATSAAPWRCRTCWRWRRRRPPRAASGRRWMRCWRGSSACLARRATCWPPSPSGGGRPPQAKASRPASRRSRRSSPGTCRSSSWSSGGGRAARLSPWLKESRRGRVGSSSLPTASAWSRSGSGGQRAGGRAPTWMWASSATPCRPC